MSYSQPFLTIRATERTALRTGHGSVLLIGLDKRSPVPAGFIAEHCFEGVPARIRDGFRHLGLLELGRTHIADNNQTVFARDFGGRFMGLIAARVRDLGVDGIDPTLVTSALGRRESFFVSPVVLERRNRFTIAARRQGLQAKVNANNAIACRQGGFFFTSKRDVPASPGVLDKCAELNRLHKLARLPKTEFLSVPRNDAHAGIDKPALERNPPKRALGAPARPEARRAFDLIARDSELATNLADGIRANSKFGASTFAKTREFEMGGPARYTPRFPIALGLALDLTAVIPNKISGTRMAFEPFATRRVLNSEFVRNEHGVILS